MANLWQELQDGSGVQCANCKSDEKDECVFHKARLHQWHDDNSGEGEGIDHRHTQERKAPHWGSKGWEGWMEEEEVKLKQNAVNNVS